MASLRILWGYKPNYSPAEFVRLRIPICRACHLSRTRQMNKEQEHKEHKEHLAGRTKKPLSAPYPYPFLYLGPTQPPALSGKPLAHLGNCSMVFR